MLSEVAGLTADVLWEEELDLLIVELAEFGGKSVVDANMVCISPTANY
jgi:hypothetical protein